MATVIHRAARGCSYTPGSESGSFGPPSRRHRRLDDHAGLAAGDEQGGGAQSRPDPISFRRGAEHGAAARDSRCPQEQSRTAVNAGLSRGEATAVGQRHQQPTRGTCDVSIGDDVPLGVEMTPEPRPLSVWIWTTSGLVSLTTATNRCSSVAAPGCDTGGRGGRVRGSGPLRASARGQRQCCAHQQQRAVKAPGSARRVEHSESPPT